MRPSDFSAQLAGLKERLTHGRDFIEAAKYFLDHLGESDEFLHACHPAQCEKLQRILGMALQQFFNKKFVGTSAGHLLRARGTPFYHGSFLAEGYVATVFYFDEIAMGLLTLAGTSDPTVHTIRLTAHLLGTGPIQN